MKIDVIPIGNSKGIRIPKPILKQCHIEETVDLEVEGDHIIISPDKEIPRQGWDNAFKAMHSNNEDRLVVDDSLELDTEGWEW